MNRADYNTSVRQWADDAYQMAMRCCNDRDVAQDAVQDALTALWECIEQVSHDKGKSYVLTVTYRKVMDHFRYEKRQQANSEALRIEQVTAVTPNEDFDLHEQLEAALQQLPEVQRAILQLRDVEGYSYKEISNILKISEQRVPVYLFRARVSIKKFLKDYQS